MGSILKQLTIDSNLNGERLFLTQEFVKQAILLLPKHVNGSGHENVLYIAGTIDGENRYGMVVVLPDAETGPRFYNTSPASHLAVLEAVSSLDLAIVGQIHTHPGQYVSHSRGDDDLAFTKGQGFWSLVVPFYGTKGFLPLSQCGVHCFQSEEFQILTPEAAQSRVVVLPEVIDLRL